MRTSTKLLLGAFVIFVIALMVYNFQLKAEYLTGNYKNPFKNFNKINIDGFTEVEINGASMMDIELKQGDFLVGKAKYNEDSIQFTKAGNRLIVNINLSQKPVIDSGAEENENGRVVRIGPAYRKNRILISCPKLTSLVTSDSFLVNGKPYSSSSFFYDIRETRLSVFKSDSLSLELNSRHKIILNGDIIKSLKATVNRNASLSMSGNMFTKANLQINNGANLTMGNQPVADLTYRLGDSVNIKLSGVSVKSFIKQQP